MAVETDTKEKVKEAPTQPGDHDKLSHYVRKNEHMLARIEGRPIKALCGKVWLPTRDGTKFPVCPECKEIYNSMKE